MAETTERPRVEGNLPEFFGDPEALYEALMVPQTTLDRVRDAHVMRDSEYGLGHIVGPGCYKDGSK